MFRAITIFSILILGFTAAASYVCFFRERPNDRETYTQLLESTTATKSRKKIRAKQTRQGVQKDIWKEETHTRIRSKSSELSLQQPSKTLEIAENLEQLSCCMEEKTQFRRLDAKSGVYLHPSGRFTAHEVELSVCETDASVLRATAENAEILWPSSIHLLGNVRLYSAQEKETFALADDLQLYPSEEICELQSANRVLLWQDDLKLSAARVQIRRDPKTGEPQVKGTGDVRFSFDLAEEAEIQELFGKWL